MLLEPSGDATSVLELVEEALDEIALAVEDLAVVTRYPATAGRRDAGSDAALAQELAEPIGIVGLVGDESAVGGDHVDQRAGGTEVMRLTRAQGQAHRQAAAIDHGVDLGC